MMEYIKKEVLEKDTGIDMAALKRDLLAAVKKQGGGTVLIKRGGLDFLYFTKMANGRKNVLKMGGNYKGSYTTIEIR